MSCMLADLYMRIFLERIFNSKSMGGMVHTVVRLLFPTIKMKRCGVVDSKTDQLCRGIQ